MADPNLENRLREHLARVAERPAPAKLEQRILERADKKAHPAANWRSTVAVLLTIVVLAVLFTIIAGHQTTQDVFSNVSSGLQ